MKGYKNKVNELQKQIEEKAKELGELQYQVEELTKQRYAIGESITKAEGELKRVCLEKDRMENEISEANQRLIKALSPFKVKVSSLEEAIRFLSSLVGVKRKDLAEIEVIKREIEALGQKKAEASRLYEEILEKNKEALVKLSQTVRQTEEELRKQREIQKEIEGQKEAVSLQLAGLNKRFGELKFYARRLYKFYMEKGIAFPPELLEEVAPLKYFPSRALQEKLRLKKKLKQHAAKV